MTNDGEQAISTDAVAVKLPPIWTEDLETWFLQAEAQFAIRKITTEETRFYHVVAALSADCATKVKNIIRAPPQEPYTALKAALLQKYEPTKHERAAAILAIKSLGDNKPSHLMDRFVNLLGEHEGGILLRYHFISILPSFVRNSLATCVTDDLQKLAEEADKIFLTGRDPIDQQVFAASNSSEVLKVTSKQPNRKPGLCFFHARFGDKARKCESPCTWSGNGPAGQRQ